MTASSDALDLLQDFLAEAGTLLEDVDQKLIELEQRPDDRALLNDIFRGFHTIKGGAGFLDAAPLVEVCHRTETLFDQMRGGTRSLSPELFDLILTATEAVRVMFDQMKVRGMPEAANPALVAALSCMIDGGTVPRVVPVVQSVVRDPPAADPGKEPDWRVLHATITAGAPKPSGAGIAGAGHAPSANVHGPSGTGGATPALAPKPAARKPKAGEGRESTLRIDVNQFDQIFNLSGELGLTKNRLAALRNDLMSGKRDNDTVRKIDTAVNALNALVGNLQNSLMVARMQPVGRVFQRYLRLTRDLGRQLAKDVELQIEGAETGIDKTMLDELYDPLVHLIRNAVDHGVDTAEERAAAGKPPKSIIRLSAHQRGDQILIEIADDGRGMRADVMRQKAVEKGVMSVDEAAALDEQGALNLVFLPGFSTKSEASSVSGRGVGMDVVRTNIQRLKGRIDLSSVPGHGTCVRLVLPLTLAILPVLMFRLTGQTYALPLAQVREIIRLDPEAIAHVSGRPSIVLRGEVMPVISLGELVGREAGSGAVGAVVDSGAHALVLAVDSFVGQDEVVIKALDGYKPKGVAGATLSADGSLVLVLDLKELLDTPSLRVAA